MEKGLAEKATLGERGARGGAGRGRVVWVGRQLSSLISLFQEPVFVAGDSPLFRPHQESNLCPRTPCP